MWGQQLGLSRKSVADSSWDCVGDVNVDSRWEWVGDMWGTAGGTGLETCGGQHVDRFVDMFVGV